MVLHLLIKYLTKCLIILFQQIYASTAQDSLPSVLVDQDGHDITVKSEPENGTLTHAETALSASKVMTNFRVQYAIFKYHFICMYVCFFLLLINECSVMFNIAETAGGFGKERSNTEKT